MRHPDTARAPADHDRRLRKEIARLLDRLGRRPVVDPDPLARLTAAVPLGSLAQSLVEPDHLAPEQLAVTFPPALPDMALEPVTAESRWGHAATAARSPGGLKALRPALPVTLPRRTLPGSRQPWQPRRQSSACGIARRHRSFPPVASTARTDPPASPPLGISPLAHPQQSACRACCPVPMSTVRTTKSTSMFGMIDTRTAAIGRPGLRATPAHPRQPSTCPSPPAPRTARSADRPPPPAGRAADQGGGA
nr:hypothetical protein [Streptomyces sp. TLI_105]